MTKQSARKKGLSEAIILKSLEIVEKEGLGSVRISAQSYLEKYYAKFGFVKCSDEYLEIIFLYIFFFNSLELFITYLTPKQIREMFFKKFASS